LKQTEAHSTVLIVEDEPHIRMFLRTTLLDNGYQTLEALTARHGLALVAERHPQLILLDLGLPDLDGIEVTRRLREWSVVPIIVVSARGQEQDKVDALDAGADDYLTKPFGVKELLARVRVALRHAERAAVEPAEPSFEAGRLHIDFVSRRVCVDGQEVHLTPNEYKLLTTLARNAGKVLTHRQLLKAVWGLSYTNENHYLRVYMGQLRHKLEVDPARPEYLLTESGVGYRLKSD
jgi:two-component system KDP operon response regulator KdpE